MAEHELICAVIARAIEDARINTDIYRGKQKDEMVFIKDHAKEWLLSKSKRDRGFEWFCNLVDLSSEYIRERLYKEKVLEKPHEEERTASGFEAIP